MADKDKRLKFYNGQFLQQQDFTDEQEYHLDRLRRHNRQMHTYGVADGLTVTANVGATSAVVAPGTALDGEGRQIVLTQQRNVSFGSLTNQWVLVVISYAEQPSDPASVGDEGDTRWLERPEVAVIPETGAPAADVRIRLARLQIAGNGTVSQHDTAVRTSAGVRLGTEVAIERIRLSRPGVSSNLWPVLSSGAAQQADLTGNLNVAGNIVVSGTVDGRDVSADGTKLDNLALSQIQGVSNPGGNIALTGANGITIAGNDATNTIAFTGAAPTSIDGVSNAGGNIDLANGGAIVITPDNGSNKRITISETHSAVTGNPHGTLASQLGEYDLKARYTSVISFSQFDGEGATRTVNVGFQPRLIWSNGHSSAVLNGWWFGGVTSGVARIEGGNISQNAAGPSVMRTTSAPGIIHWSHGTTGVIGTASYTDFVSNPGVSFTVTVRVSSSTANSVTFTLSRPATVSSFEILIYFTCFGY